MFGGRKQHNAQLQAEVARLSTLPLPGLAAEVMAKGFGPDGPAGDGRYAALRSIAGALSPAEGSRSSRTRSRTCSATASRSDSRGLAKRLNQRSTS
jgi:hypothetical protein